MAARKSASLVFQYYGDSKFQTFFQEAQNIGKAMQGQDYNVLLKHERKEAGLDLNQQDEKRCDIKDKPTQENFVKYVLQLAEEGYMTDIWIFSHGWTDGFRVSKGTFGENGQLTSTELTDELDPSKIGFRELPIRLVYGVNCYGSTMAKTWRNLGAKAVVGARFVNFYPNQFVGFANQWNKGDVAVKKAVAEADTAASRTLVQTYLATIDAPKQKKAGKWGGCTIPNTVLGKNACAKDYFTNVWIDTSEWQSGKEGKENMNHSSEMIITGDSGLKKNTVPTWAGEVQTTSAR